MAWNDGLTKLPPVASIQGVVGALDQAFGAENWIPDLRYMSPAYCVARVSVTANEYQVSREYAALEGIGAWNSAEVAIARVFEFLGGKVNWPKQTSKLEQVPAALPKPSGTPSAKPMSHSLPSNYSGPVPYNDSHTNIPPVSFPKPPQEPDWFGAKIGGFATKKGCSWTKEFTWKQIVDEELANPGGRDQALGFVKWKLGKDAPTFDPKDGPGLKKAWEQFVGRAKAASIWAMLRIDQMREESDGYDEPAVEEEIEETPF